jgi:hypothetical protein
MCWTSWLEKHSKTCGLAIICFLRATSNTGKDPAAFSLLREKFEAGILPFCHFLGTTKSQMEEHSPACNEALLDNPVVVEPYCKQETTQYTLFHIHVAVEGRASSNSINARSAHKLFVCILLITFTIGIHCLRSNNQ